MTSRTAASPLFTLDDGSEFQLDYFQETEKNHIWLEDYMEDLEFAVLHVSEMVAPPVS